MHNYFISMKKLFILSVLVLLYSCKTSNYIKYHRIINEAEYSFYNEDYQTAAQLYGKAFNKVKIPIEADMYFYAASLWEIGEQAQSMALMDTMLYLEWKLTKTGFFQGMDSLTMRELIQKNEAKVAVINQRRDNEPLLIVFDSINERDQKPRRNINEVLANYPMDTLKIWQAGREVAKADSINQLTVDSLIKQHGFIGGVHFPANPQIMHLFLMHSLEWVYHNPRLFRKAIRQGRLLPQDFAVPYDKSLLWYKGEETVRYGQFTNKLQGVSPEKVFKEARKIGISPYFIELNNPQKRGRQPEKHFYYEYYKERKDRFRCF